MRPYRKMVSYEFSVEGYELALTNIDPCLVCVEETRNNGQEDTHMQGVLSIRMDGTFGWEEGERGFIRYGSKELADGIVQYLNTHGLPGRKKK